MRYINIAVEGPLDAAVLGRLVDDAGAALARPAFTKGGRAPLLADLRRYVRAARISPWVVMCDLDRDHCAPAFVDQHAPEAPPDFCFRIAVRAVESWLLADIGIASYLGVSVASLPRNPDSEQHPKRLLLQLAQGARHRRVRDGLYSGDSPNQVGPEYNLMLSEFAGERWDPQQAAHRSDSLRRAIAAIERLAVR